MEKSRISPPPLMTLELNTTLIPFDFSEISSPPLDSTLVLFFLLLALPSISLSTSFLHKI
jgi:hypothetical protein